jgi:putative transcription factor
MSKRREKEEYYCDICGAKIVGRPYFALVDGVEMVLCASCFLKLSKSGRAKLIRVGEPKEEPTKKIRKRVTGKTVYEVVEDYAERIATARIKKGLSTKDLAAKLRISENVLRKIEQGRFKPSIDLARKMERILGIKLVEPTEEPEEEEFEAKEELPTLGDIVVVRRDKK